MLWQRMETLSGGVRSRVSIPFISLNLSVLPDSRSTLYLARLYRETGKKEAVLASEALKIVAIVLKWEILSLIGRAIFVFESSVFSCNLYIYPMDLPT